MTVATPSSTVDSKNDPEQYRMTIGEHLEELRWRLILALIGFAVVLGFCLYYGNTVVAYFCRPLLLTLKSRGLPPWTVDRALGGSFMVFMKISFISSAAISAPWAVYQLWLFVAAGLYPHERRWVTRYAPLSITLLITGMLFVYFLVLPWTIQFFVDWTANMPIPEYSKSEIVAPTTPPLNVPIYEGDPAKSAWKVGDLWYNRLEGKLNIVVDQGSLRSIPFAPMSLVVPQYELSEYIDLVVMMLLTFGLAFQLPLVVAALIKIGIFEPEQLKSVRRYIYFGLLIVAAVITPGDVITATIALMIPLILLYEFGIFLGQLGGKLKADDEADAA
ncbi:MAG TPA: twin-arginine translocase subunit TatC [Tepidisphaeraceae bacterium]|nr:twin-arginine translocase subunit TatC [Tepidisphaeraceae bacterium]